MFDTFMYVRFLKRKNWENSHIKTLRSLPLIIRKTWSFRSTSNLCRVRLSIYKQNDDVFNYCMSREYYKSYPKALESRWEFFSRRGAISHAYWQQKSEPQCYVSRARKSKVEHRGREVCDQFLHTSYFLFLNFTSIKTIVIKRGSTINKFCGPWSILTLDDLVWRANILDKEACFGVNSIAAKC